jgi:hypothetical protein
MPSPAAAYMPSDHRAMSLSMPFGMSLDTLKTLCGRRSHPKFWTGDTIPAKKLFNARKALGLPATDEVVALIDFTTFGSANHALLVASSGIYFANSGNAAQSLSWGGLRSVGITGSSGSARGAFVRFSDGVSINCAGAHDLVETLLAPLITEIIAQLRAAQPPVVTPLAIADASQGAVEFDFNVPAYTLQDPDRSTGASMASIPDSVQSSSGFTFDFEPSLDLMPAVKEPTQSATNPAAVSSPGNRDGHAHSLVGMVARIGERFWTEPAVCRAVLGDLGRDFSKREINALVGAVTLQIPVQIQADGSGLAWPAQRHRMAQLIHDDLGLLESLAHWAVDAWALAFGKSAASNPVAASVTSVAIAQPSVAAPQASAGAGTPRLHVRLVRLESEAGDDFVNAEFEVHNESGLNFTDLSIALSVFDRDGDMVSKECVSGRVKPKGKLFEGIYLECAQSELGAVVVDRMETFSQVNGEFLGDCSASEKSLLQRLAITVESAVPGVIASARAGAAWDDVA